MSDIEAKINSKLLEIEGLFSDKNAPPVPPPVIIKNSSTLIQSGLNQIAAAGEGDPGEEVKTQKKGQPAAKNGVKNAAR